MAALHVRESDMTEHHPENTQFFLTSETPCPYLPNRMERKLFAHMSGRRAQSMHSLLSNYGFRRSQNIVYRPACEGCTACKSVRIEAHGFKPGRRHRRISRQNGDVISVAQRAEATAEQFELFTRYLHARHPGGGMTDMGRLDYDYMVEDTPVETIQVEYRLDIADEPLIAVALTDVMPDGLSMVYSFFEPELRDRSLGHLMILDHIERTLSLGLEFVYLGYWVKGSPKMAYKSEYAPLQVQTGALGWHRLNGSVD